MPTSTSKANSLGASLLFDDGGGDYDMKVTVKTREGAFLNVKRPSNLNRHHRERNIANSNKQTHKKINSFVRDQYSFEYAFSRKHEPTETTRSCQTCGSELMHYKIPTIYES